MFPFDESQLGMAPDLGSPRARRDTQHRQADRTDGGPELRGQCVRRQEQTAKRRRTGRRSGSGRDRAFPDPESVRPAAASPRRDCRRRSRAPTSPNLPACPGRRAHSRDVAPCVDWRRPGPPLAAGPGRIERAHAVFGLLCAKLALPFIVGMLTTNENRSTSRRGWTGVCWRSWPPRRSHDRAVRARTRDPGVGVVAGHCGSSRRQVRRPMRV